MWLSQTESWLPRQLPNQDSGLKPDKEEACSVSSVGSIRLQGLFWSTDSGCHLLCRGRASSGPAINEKPCKGHCLFQWHRLFPEGPPTLGWKGDTPQKDADKLKAPELQELFRT